MFSFTKVFFVLKEIVCFIFSYCSKANPSVWGMVRPPDRFTLLGMAAARKV